MVLGWKSWECPFSKPQYLPQGISQGYTLIRKQFICSLTHQFSSVTQSCLTLWPHALQHTRLPCPSLTNCWSYSNSCPLSQWCHPIVSSSVTLFSSCFQSFPVSGSFPRCQFFTSCGQSIRVTASALVLPTNIQDWVAWGLSGLISLESKGLSRVFSKTTFQKL